MKRFRLWLIILLTLTASPPAAADDDAGLGGDDLWWDGFPVPGALTSPTGDIRARIYAAAVVEGELHVAGRFEMLDGDPVVDLAKRVGSRWEQVDTEKLPWTVTTMAVHGGSLIVGGSNSSSSAGTSCLYRLADQGWEPFGPDTLRSPRTKILRIKHVDDDLLVLGYHYPEGLSGRLAPLILLWDGEEWHDRGRGVVLSDYNSYVTDAVLYQGEAILAGRLSLADTDAFFALARVTASGLEPMDIDTDGIVNTLTVYQDRVVAGGRFNRAGSVDAQSLAVWDGESWSSLGPELRGGYGPEVRQLLVSGDNLFVQGFFDSAGTVPAGDFATWTGTAWEGSPATDWVSTRLADDLLIEFEGRPLIGGRITIGRFDYYGLAQWKGDSWGFVPGRGTFLVYPALALLPTEDGLVVSGLFTLPDRLEVVSAVALWNGSDWRLLTQELRGSVHALTQYRGHLIAGGSFESIDGIEALEIARWDGKTWQQVGNGMNGSVGVLAVYDGRLVAGGSFTRAGHQDASLIAQWDGLSWSPMGNGLSGSLWQTVKDLEIYGGRLFTAGNFIWAGENSVDGIACWDGHGWTRPGPQSPFYPDYPVWGPNQRQLVTWNGRLVIRGSFDEVSGQKTNGLAVWDGATWSPLNPPLAGYTDCIDTHQGRLVVGGHIGEEGGDRRDREVILQHDGEVWLSMGSGLAPRYDNPYAPGTVSALATWQGSLYVSGDFIYAGGKPSSFIARWDGAALAPPRFDRLRAAPNPATDAATLHYRLDGPGPVSIQVFDVRGRRVATLREGFMTGGDHTETWDLRDSHGRRVPVGVYFLRVDSPLSHAAEKIVVIR